MNWQTFGLLLAREGLVADSALPAPDGQAIPGYLQLLSGLGAWLAALFALGALASASFLESAGARAALGVVVCALCAWRARTRAPGAFLGQFLTAMTLAGAALIVSIVLDGGFDVRGLLLPAALVAAVLLVANPEPVSRLLMALVMVGALASAAAQWGLLPLACVALAGSCSLLWRKQAAWTQAGLGPLLAPVGASCAVALVLLPGFSHGGLMADLAAGAVGAGQAGSMLLALQGHWLAPAGIALALAVTIILAARHLPACAARAVGFAPLVIAAAAALAVAAWQAPGILACLLVWALGMTAGRPLLTGLGLAGIGLYLFQLYYSLHATLLGKGLALIATGLVLLLLHFLLARWWLPVAGGVDGPAAATADG